MMSFSEKLMDLRRKSGLSQEQLADRLGVTRQSVSKWESGTAMPELVKLISLSDIFGVSVDYLVKDYLEEPESAGGGDDLSAQQAVRLEKRVVTERDILTMSAQKASTFSRTVSSSKTATCCGTTPTRALRS